MGIWENHGIQVNSCCDRQKLEPFSRLAEIVITNTTEKLPNLPGLHDGTVRVLENL